MPHDKYKHCGHHDFPPLEYISSELTRVLQGDIMTVKTKLDYDFDPEKWLLINLRIKITKDDIPHKDLEMNKPYFCALLIFHDDDGCFEHTEPIIITKTPQGLNIVFIIHLHWGVEAGPGVNITLPLKKAQRTVYFYPFVDLDICVDVTFHLLMMLKDKLSNGFIINGKAGYGLGDLKDSDNYTTEEALKLSQRSSYINTVVV